MYLCTDHVEGGYEVSWAVYQVSATSDRRLVEIHGIRVFETGVPRGLAVYGHQVVVKHGNYGLRLLIFRLVWPLTLVFFLGLIFVLKSH